MNILRDYYYLTKPGLIYGNLLTVAGGYLYGAMRHPDILTLLGVVIGSALVMASGTVINNIYDRHIDKHMKRTKKRALVTGSIRPRHAAYYAITLAIIGLTLLALFTNWLTVLLGFLGLITYAGVYTYAKPRTVHATLLGTIPGALPPLAGYIAATNRVDASFWILFTLMACWQMAHFYAIAIYRQKDYAAANIPVITVHSGVPVAKRLILLFGCAYMISAVMLAFLGDAGLLFLIIMIPLSTWWLFIIIKGLRTDDAVAWARKVFFISLILLPSLCIALAINAWAP